VIRPVLPLLALLLGGCFATTQQVQQLQDQLGQMRAETARRDSTELATLTKMANEQQRMTRGLLDCAARNGLTTIDSFDSDFTGLYRPPR